MKLSTLYRYPFAIVFILLAFFLRIDDVGEYAVRWDEAFSVRQAQMDFDLGTEFTARDVHPPLYFWTLHVWIRLTGVSEFAIRSLSLFFSLIGVVAVACFTRRISGNWLAAWIAFALLALSAYHIKWSQDARMYGMTMMFVSLTVYAYIRGRHRLLIAAGIGLLLTHYFGALVFAILTLHRLLFWQKRRAEWRRFIIAIATIAVVCLPWYLYAMGEMRTDANFATFDPKLAYQLFATLYTVSAGTHLYVFEAPVLLISIGFLAVLALHWRNDAYSTALILLGSVLPPLIVTSLALPFIPFHVNGLTERHFAIFFPFVFAGYGTGLALLVQRRRLKMIGILAVVALLMLNAHLASQKRASRYFRDDFRSMMAAVSALSDDESGEPLRIFFASGGRNPVVQYHLDRVGFSEPRNAQGSRDNVVGIPTHTEDVPALMERIVAGFPSFWLLSVEAHLDEPHKDTNQPSRRIAWLDQTHTRRFHIPHGWYNGISLYSRVDDSAYIPDLDTIIPPVVSEARPGDFVRIGVPAGNLVELLHGGQVIDSAVADTWQLHQFHIPARYPNGEYELRVADTSYPFIVANSRQHPEPGS